MGEQIIIEKIKCLGGFYEIFFKRECEFDKVPVIESSLIKKEALLALLCVAEKENTGEYFCEAG